MTGIPCPSEDAILSRWMEDYDALNHPPGIPYQTLDDVAKNDIPDPNEH